MRSSSAKRRMTSLVRLVMEKSLTLDISAKGHAKRPMLITSISGRLAAVFEATIQAGGVKPRSSRSPLGLLRNGLRHQPERHGGCGSRLSLPSSAVTGARPPLPSGFTTALLKTAGLNPMSSRLPLHRAMKQAFGFWIRRLGQEDRRPWIGK